MSLTDLPSDVLDIVVSSSTFRSLHRLSLTNRNFNSKIENSDVWNTLMNRFDLKLNPRARIYKTALSIIKRDLCTLCFAARKDRTAEICVGCTALWQGFLDERAYCDRLRDHLAQALEVGDDEAVEICIWKLHVREHGLKQFELRAS